MERRGRVGEIVECAVPGDEASQRVVGHEVVALAAEAADEGAHADGEDVVSPEVAPDSGQLASGLYGLRARGDECRVEGTRRGTDEQIGGDALFVERAQHPRVQGA